MEFLKTLDNLLVTHNMKRADLARAINVAPSTINSWYARGTDKVKLQVLIDISNYFNVSLEYLINGKESPSIINADHYSAEELKLINDFCTMLKERR